jgi:hypothetical protein
MERTPYYGYVECELELEPSNVRALDCTPAPASGTGRAFWRLGNVWTLLYRPLYGVLQPMQNTNLILCHVHWPNSKSRS